MCCSEKIRQLVFIILIFFSVGMVQQSFAQSNKQTVYGLSLAILSYSKWDNVQRPILCVIDNSYATTQFRNLNDQLEYDFRIKAVSASTFLHTDCHAAFFSTTPVYEQQQLISKYHLESLLSISNNNPNCEIGTIFCIYTEKQKVSFKVNLDTLGHSKIRIDPRVLLLAKNEEQE